MTPVYLTRPELREINDRAADERARALSAILTSLLQIALRRVPAARRPRVFLRTTTGSRHTRISA
jgi:hypothetical protein